MGNSSWLVTSSPQEFPPSHTFKLPRTQGSIFYRATHTVDGPGTLLLWNHLHGGAWKPNSSVWNLSGSSYGGVSYLFPEFQIPEVHTGPKTSYFSQI